jgi:hypothetical protein
MKSIKPKISTRLFSHLSRLQSYSKIKKIQKQAKLIPEAKNPERILFGPGFNVLEAFSFHDFLFAAGLRSRGAKLHFTGCQSFLSACSVYGGVWEVDGERLKSCQKCSRCDLKFQSWVAPFGDYSKVKDVVSTEKLDEYRKLVAEIPTDQLASWTYKDIKVGFYALNVLTNVNMVSDYRLVPNWEGLFRENVVTNLAFLYFFEKLISDFKPTRIFSHDSFYSPWSILMDLAIKNKIPFYNYYFGARKNTWHYTLNETAMDLNSDKYWSTFKDKALSPEQRKKIEAILEERKKGHVGIISQSRDMVFNAEIEKLNKFKESGKPIAVLYSNVVWDLAALNKQIVFSSIQDSYIETVEWFKDHPQYQLVVKSHPDEENPKIPRTVEQIKNILARKFSDLPDNVLLTDPKSNITAYELFEFSRVSIVHTTTAGLESPIYGVPTITLGKTHYREKGFTFDPISKSDYFSTLVGLLNDPLPLNEKIENQERALKFFYMYMFEYNIDYGLFEHSWGEKLSSVSPRSLTELEGLHDFQQLLDTIIAGKDFL